MDAYPDGDDGKLDTPQPDSQSMYDGLSGFEAAGASARGPAYPMPTPSPYIREQWFRDRDLATNWKDWGSGKSNRTVEFFSGMSSA